MDRNELIQQLVNYRERWEDESIAAKQFIDFVSTNEDCFNRELQLGHVTGSAWVVNKAGTHVLLTHHKKLNKWLQLGGHADGDSDILRVAKREVEEESGISDVEPVSDQIFDIDVHLIPARGGEPTHYHYDIRYAMRVTGDETFVVSDESHDLAWIEVTDMASVSQEKSMLRMASKWGEWI